LFTFVISALFPRLLAIAAKPGINGEDIDIDNEVREEHIMNPRHEEENVNLNPDARRKRDRIARLFR
jgi:hypothetical protein